MNVSTFLTSCGAVFMVSASVVPATAQLRVDQTNLVSDIPGLAKLTDPDLVNAWGISFGPTSPFWISDNGTGLATLYSVPGSGPPSVSKLALTVTIPPTAGGTTSAPTGQVFNGGVGFGGAVFLFDSEDGVISGWNGQRNERGRRQRFRVGRCLQGSRDLGPRHKRRRTVRNEFPRWYDRSLRSQLRRPASVTGNFTDPNLPKGYAPFNDKVINGELYVTYAKQDADKHDDEAGAWKRICRCIQSGWHVEGAPDLAGSAGLAMGPADRAVELRVLRRRPSGRKFRQWNDQRLQPNHRGVRGHA